MHPPSPPPPKKEEEEEENFTFGFSFITFFHGQSLINLGKEYLDFVLRLSLFYQEN